MTEELDLLAHQSTPIPGALTLGELRAILNAIPTELDHLVMAAPGDSEGNSFNTLSYPMIGWLRNFDEDTFRGSSPKEGESWADALERATQDYRTEDGDLDEPFDLDKYDHVAICLG